MHAMKGPPSLVLPYELRIGVTGHRELADPAAVGRAVRRVLDGLAVSLSRSPQVPLRWTVISPLAKGADRIVAVAVLEREDARLQLITPLPLDDYRQDFEESPDRDEFEALRRRAETVRELDSIGDGPVPRGPRRNRAYLHCGRQVVDSCEILICVWDGKDAADVGGTADIVKYARRRGRVVLRIDPGNPDTLPAELGNAGAISPGYQQQMAFLSDNTVDAAQLRTDVANETSTLLRAAAAAAMPSAVMDGVVANLVPTYVKADRLAMAYRKRYVRATNAILFLAAIAVTIAAAQIIFRNEQPQFVLAEVLAMLGVLGVWWISHRLHWHEKWLQDRFLAEQLRCAMYLTIAGVADDGSVDDLPFYPGPHQWLESAVRTLSRATPIARAPLAAVRSFVCAGWLRDQQTFHRNNAKSKAEQAKRRHELGLGLFAATLLMALLHFFNAGEHLDRVMGIARDEPFLEARKWIEFLALVLPAWAASVHAITSQLELERIAARSAGMTERLEELAKSAEESESLAALQRVSLEAAALMAAETREWWALLSFQHLNIHA